MKIEKPLYPMRRTLNHGMRHGVSIINSHRLASESEKERVLTHACRKENGIENAPSLAMVFSPIQEWRELYDVTTALERGTLFRELDKPLEVCGRCMGGGTNGF